MEFVQNNTDHHTKMPRHVEGMKVAGALTLAAVAYFAQRHFLVFTALSAVRLWDSGKTFQKTGEVKFLQIAASISLIVCSFKKYHRAIAGTYILCASKISYDYFFTQDQMIAKIFDHTFSPPYLTRTIQTHHLLLS